MIYLGNNPVGINMDSMKLIHQHTLTSNYTTTLSSLYTNEIQPYITFGDYTKMCVVVFRNNTTALENSINVVFFSLAVDIQTAASNAVTGGMIRSNYTNIRNLVLSNDARCSSGAQVCIYELSVI